MQRTRSKRVAQKLIGQLELMRIQLNQAEAVLFAAEEQAGIAKRKRKEAKKAHRQAKKEVRKAKRKLITARAAMSKAEADLARARILRTRKTKKPVIQAVGRKTLEPASRAAVGRKTPVARLVASLQPGSTVAETTEPPEESITVNAADECHRVQRPGEYLHAEE